MKQEFVMRGQTASGQQEILHFSGYKKGYAYRLTEFAIYPSTSIPTQDIEATGSITAGKTAVAPTDPNFNDEGLIATIFLQNNSNNSYPVSQVVVINDTFLITQDLILMVIDSAGANTPINWQCRFVSEKMNLSQEAVTNYKQFTISDGS